MILKSVEQGPLLWPTVEEDGVTRLKKYSELSAAEAIQADCDVKAKNIILQGLLPEVYALVSTHKGRQSSMSTGSSRPFASGSSGASEKQRAIVCYNCKGEGHMSKQRTKPKRKRDAEWLKDKEIKSLKYTLSEHLKEKESLEQKITIFKNDFQKEESRNIDRELALEKQNSTIPALHDDLILSVIEQLKIQVVNCTKINQDNKHVNELLTAELKRYINQERVLNELKHDDKASTSYKPSQEIKSLKYTLSEHLKEKESLEQKITIFKNDFQKEESRNIDRELALEKQAFWSQYSVQTDEPNLSATTTIVEVSKELPQVSMSAEVSDLNASLQENVWVITALKEQLNKLKGKAVLTEAVSINPIDPDLLKVDVAPLVPKLRKNRTAHTDYIRHTQDEATTLREIVESEILLSLLNTSLDYACKYTRRIQELLMILQQTCPSLTELGTKLVVVTPKNKTKQIRPTEQITELGKTTVTTPPSANLDSNTPMLSSRVILVSSASGSMSQDNTKKNRIRRTQRKAKKNKIEDHLRTVKSSLNKKSVVDSKATSSIINFMSNVNSDLQCASCNGCLFSDNHDACVVDYIKFVNAHSKSKSVKTPVKRKVWIPTGNVFKTVGHI
nr:hypothetical protein [Tanacetum cinerariifolium]